MPKQVTFLVDGFNLYHSLKKAHKRNGLKTRWLDLVGLFSGYLYLIGGGAVLKEVYYFSALAKHREASHPGTVQRHQDYIDALKSTGVKVELASFKIKTLRCPHCGKPFIRHEEKETDVAVGSRLLELAATDQADVLVVVSGDTDIVPAIATVKRLSPPIDIWVAFPHDKHNIDLERTVGVGRHFKIKAVQYARHQLPNSLTCCDGRRVDKPAAW